MKKIGLYLLLEVIVAILMYFAFIQENEIASYILQGALVLSLIWSFIFYWAVSTKRVPINLSRLPSQNVVKYSILRDLAFSIIFFAYGWFYCAIAVLIICFMNVKTVMSAHTL